MNGARRCCICGQKKRKWKFCFLGDRWALCCLGHFRDAALRSVIDAVVAERQRLSKLETAWLN